MVRSRLLPLALLAGLAPGCDNRPPARVCMSMEGKGPVAMSAVSFGLRIYPAGTPCQGNDVAPNTVAVDEAVPISPNRPLALDNVPPGRYTVVVTAYSDNFGNQRIGGACAPDEEIRPGQDVCLDLTLTAP